MVKHCERHVAQESLSPRFSVIEPRYENGKHHGYLFVAYLLFLSEKSSARVTYPKFCFSKLSSVTYNYKAKIALEATSDFLHRWILFYPKCNINYSTVTVRNWNRMWSKHQINIFSVHSMSLWCSLSPSTPSATLLTKRWDGNFKAAEHLNWLV